MSEGATKGAGNLPGPFVQKLLRMSSFVIFVHFDRSGMEPEHSRYRSSMAVTSWPLRVILRIELDRTEG